MTCGKPIWIEFNPYRLKFRQIHRVWCPLAEHSIGMSNPQSRTQDRSDIPPTVKQQKLPCRAPSDRDQSVALTHQLPLYLSRKFLWGINQSRETDGDFRRDIVVFRY